MFENQVKSVKGNVWKVKKATLEEINQLRNYHKIQDFIANFVANKHSTDLKIAGDFLNPNIHQFLSKALQITDIDSATNIIIDAVENNRKIGIIADYDVDGSCGGAFLKLFFEDLSGHENVFTYTPDRVTEGYGPNHNAIEFFEKNGVSLIITVDCGTNANIVVDFAKTKHMQVVIIDHHKNGSILPNADAIVNPNRSDHINEFSYLCGAGVAFVVCLSIAKQMKMDDKSIEESIFKRLDMIAVATICDIVPLIGLNRAFVQEGIKLLNSSPSYGLSALIYQLNLHSKRITEIDIGFYIGPTINAGGRVGKSDSGLMLIASRDKHSTTQMAENLCNLNIHRKQIEKEIIEFALKEIEMIVKNNNPAIIIYYSDIVHEGVMGIIASRMQEKFHKPCIIGSIINTATGKMVRASCRSKSPIDIGKIVLECVDNGLAIKGGGHNCAAGFTAMEENIMNINHYIETKANHMIQNCRDDESNVKFADYKITASGINEKFAKEISFLRPFGRDNEAPVFMIENLILHSNKIVKDEHIQSFFICKSTGNRIRTISFRSVGTDLGIAILTKMNNRTLSILCSIDESTSAEYPKPNVTLHDVILD